MDMLEPQSPIEQRLALCDPARNELLTEAKTYFDSKLYAEFRDDVQEQFPGAEQCSPTAILLIGHSYYHESNWDAAAHCVAQAKKLWRNFASIAAINPSDLSSVEDDLAKCENRIKSGRETGSPDPKNPLVPHSIS